MWSVVRLVFAPCSQLLNTAATRTGACPRDASVAVLAFLAFFSVLSSYFLLLPLREESAMLLGTDSIPKLFTASLLVTLVAAPLVSSMLLRQGSNRARGHRQLFVALAAILLGFYAAFTLAVPSQQLAQLNADRSFAVGDPAAAAVAAAAVPSTRRMMHQHEQQQPSNSEQAQASPPPPMPSPPRHSSRTAHSHHHRHAQGLGRAGAGVPPLRAWLLTAFYVWHGVQNLVAISALWTLAADVFTPDAGAQLFGFLTAGATAGQLAGSLLSMAFVYASRRLAGTALMGPPVLLLPASALLMLAAARCCEAIGTLAGTQGVQGRESDTGQSTGGGVGSGGKGGREAAFLSSPDSTEGRRRRSSSTGGAAALCTAMASDHQHAAERPPPLPPPPPVSGRVWSAAGAAASPSSRRSRPAVAAAALDGFRLILASPFLLLLCAFLLLGSMVSSVVYFERAVVVAATMHDSGQRAAFFAGLNSCAAAVIFVLQLLAAGSVMRRLGVTSTLCVGPAVSLGGVALIAAYPTPSLIAGVEVVRKVIQHTLSRPTRELIFTVMSRDEKFKAKTIIDSVVLRLGDALAAAIFEILDVQMALGPSAMALVGVGICVVWVAAALQLGLLYNRRAVRQQQEKALTL